MNKIEIRKYSTPYGYDDNYISIDGKSIVMYLEEWIKAGKCKQLEVFNIMLGMYPAWGRELEWEAERAFIYEFWYLSIGTCILSLSFKIDHIFIKRIWCLL